MRSKLQKLLKQSLDVNEDLIELIKVKDGRIQEQEQTIKDTIQALKDNGRKDDALLITSLETTLKK